MTINTVYILLFCICLLALIFRSGYVPLKNGSVQAYFLRIVLLSIISCALYIGTYAQYFNRNLVEINRIFNGIYFAITAILPAMWFTYSLKVMKLFRPQMVVARILFLLPVAFFAFASIASVKTGWIFYVNDDTVYSRGPMYLAYVSSMALYMVFPMILSWAKAMSKRHYAERTMYMSLSTFGIFAILGTTLEIFTTGLPGSAMGIVLTLLVNHMATQRDHISADPLTRLNNRNQFNIFLSNILQNPPPETKVYLFVLDMDKFKRINDDFGHMKGDEALLIVSNVLKSVCGPKGHFISRFGGDEFTIVAKYNNEQECKTLIKEIQDTLTADSKDFVSILSVSIGFARATPSDNIPDLFNRADKQLYKKKRSRE